MQITKVEKSNRQLQLQFNDKNSSKTVAEQAVAELYKKYAEKREIVITSVESLKECMDFLDENALEPYKYTIEEIYHLLIQDEQREQRHGYENRVKVLKNIKENPNTLESDYFNEKEMITQEWLQKLKANFANNYKWVKECFSSQPKFMPKSDN